MRPLGKTLVAFLLTLAIAYLLATATLAVLNGGDILTALVDEAWRVLFLGGTVSLGLFLLFVLLANIAGRRRGSGSQFWINAGALVIALVLGTLTTLAAGVFVGALTAGVEWLSALTALLAAGAIFPAGLVALALTHFAIYRPRATEFEP